MMEDPIKFQNISMNNKTLRSMKQSIRFDNIEDIGELELEDKRAQEIVRTEQSRTAEHEKVGAQLLSHLSDAAFMSKYGVDFQIGNAIHNYMFTQQPRQHTYVFEAFASVASIPTDSMKHKKEEVVFHAMFEDIIERYTRTRSKPNPILMETRNSEFCYRLTIIVEAVPLEVQNTLGFNLSTLRLLREFEILYSIWEKFREDLQSKSCTSDLLVGIPMPFEFVCVTGNEFDFELVKTAIYYFDIHGAYVPVKAARIPSSGRPLGSFLNYMSVEKLGPNLSYLAELMRSQKRSFSVSSSLKILDQILCRLMVLHKYGIILGNMDLKHLNFGVREALNVLYVNNFDCAVAAPTNAKPLACFNERFASLGVLKGQIHFVNDIETAFYIFLSLLINRLPWDDKDSFDPRLNGSWAVTERNRSLKPHIDERSKLWESPNSIERLLHACCINTEASTPGLECFAYDVILMVFTKIKEAISACAGIPQQEYMTAALTVSTVPHNAYTNVRKVIVSFFRFESLSNTLKDATCLNKVERLLESESVDNRALWDLNDWCWNIFESSFLGGSRKISKSVKV